MFFFYSNRNFHLQAEQRRHREWAGRLERERQLQLENYAIRLQAAEVESTNLRDEAARLREQLEKARSERTAFQEAAEDARRESQEAQEAERKAIAKANEAQSLMEAAREELIVRTTEDQHRLEELVQEVTRLRARNKSEYEKPIPSVLECAQKQRTWAEGYSLLNSFLRLFRPLVVG